MAIISEKLGKPRREHAYLAYAEKLKKTINDVFWDEKDGFYYDRNEKTGERIRVKSVAGFIPLWAGVAHRSKRASSSTSIWLNKDEFWLTYPVALYAKTEPDFYQGVKNGECNWRGPVVDSDQLHDSSMA